MADLKAAVTVGWKVGSTVDLSAVLSVFQKVVWMVVQSVDRPDVLTAVPTAAEMVGMSVVRMVD